MDKFLERGLSARRRNDMNPCQTSRPAPADAAKFLRGVMANPGTFYRNNNYELMQGESPASATREAAETQVDGFPKIKIKKQKQPQNNRMQSSGAFHLTVAQTFTPKPQTKVGETSITTKTLKFRRAKQFGYNTPVFSAFHSRSKSTAP